MKTSVFSKNTLRLPALLTLWMAVFSLKAATLIWTNTAGGDWQTAVNWNPNQIPGTNDTALITNDATYTVNLTGSVTVSNLFLGGTSGTQTLHLQNGTLVLNGTGTGSAQSVMDNGGAANDQQGGVLEGAGTFTMAGLLNWVEAGTLALPLLNTPGQTVLDGATWSGGLWVNTGELTNYATFVIQSGSVLSNAPAGIVSSASVYVAASYANYTGAGTIINNGQFLVPLLANPAAAFDTYCLPEFINNGTLYVGNAFTLTGATNNGTFDLIGDLDCSNAVVELSSGSVVEGAGSLENQGTLYLDGSVTCGSFTDLGTTWVTGSLGSPQSGLDGDTIFTNAGSFTGIMSVGGTANFAGTGSIQPSTLSLGGLLTGSGLVNATTLNWGGGIISGRVQCAGGTISGYINSGDPCSLLGGELINTGLLTVQNTMYAPNISLFVMGGGGVVSNTLAAHMNFVGFQAGPQITGPCIFYNAGLLTFTNSGDPFSPGVPGSVTLAGLANSGTILMESNVSLTLENGTTNSGLIIVADNSAVSLSGPATFLLGSSFSADGGFTPANDIATLGGTFNVGGTVNFQSGTNTVTGAATFTNAVNISAGFVNFNGSTLISGLTTTTGGTTSFGGSGSATVNSLMISAGSVNVTNGCHVNIPNGTTLAGGTLNLNGTGSVTSTSLALTDGTETGTQAFQLSGPLNWTGPVGNITGFIIANGGSINVPASSAVWDGGQLYNTGIMTWTPNSGPRTGAGTVISNTASGVINVALNGNTIDSYAYGPPTAFYNAGQINVSGAGQTGSITDPFFNTGTVTINSGTLSLGYGGTNAGTITAVGGADLDFSGGIFYSTPGSLISGAGSLSDSGSSGTYTFAGPLNLTGSWTFGSYATVNLTGTTTASGNTNNLTGNGTVNYYGTGNGGAWRPGTVNLNNYTTLGGSTPVIASGPLNWTGTGGNITNILSASGGAINVSASSAVWDGGQLYNTGTMTWTPNSGPRTGQGTVISNTASGIINVALNGNNIESYGYGGTTAFYNAGQINISGAGQTGYITDPFYNTGTLNVNSGTLETTFGGTNYNTIMVASGATNNFFNGTFNATAGSKIIGAGNLTVGGGTFNSAGALSLSGGASAVALELAGGTANFTGTGTVTPGQVIIMANGALEGTQPVVTSGPLTWTGGNISGIISANGGNVNVTEFSTLGSGGQLINTGTMAWTPNSGPRTGGGAGTVISNAFNGIINVALNGNNIESSSYGGTVGFYNAGQINIFGPGQTGYITDPFYNTGTVNLNSGTLGINGGASLAGGTLNFGINNLTDFGTLTFPGSIALAGTLGVTFIGYVPVVSNSFTLINYTSETGMFANYKLPGTVNWQKTYGPTQFSLLVNGLIVGTTNIFVLPASPAFTSQGFNFAVTGPAGSNYVVQVSTNLLGGNWTALTNFTSSTTNSPVTDPNAKSYYRTRFYRAYIH